VPKKHLSLEYFFLALKWLFQYPTDQQQSNSGRCLETVPSEKRGLLKLNIIGLTINGLTLLGLPSVGPLQSVP
jgi:hypothetical protein